MTVKFLLGDTPTTKEITTIEVVLNGMALLCNDGTLIKIRDLVKITDL